MGGRQEKQTERGTGPGAAAGPDHLCEEAGAGEDRREAEVCVQGSGELSLPAEPWASPCPWDQVGDGPEAG